MVAAGVAMYLRDFLAVALALCAMVVSLQREHTFSFRKAWYHHAEEDNTVLFETTRLPPPTLCDLNGDGKLEILVATYDGKLQLLAPAPPGKQGEGFAAARIKAEIQVVEIPMVRPVHFVAVKTGFIEPMPDNLVAAPRKEVVVIVTTDFKVHCYDHNLVKLWEQDLGNHFGSRSNRDMVQSPKAHEISILITPHRIRSFDRGVVVVGGSFLRGEDVAGGRSGDILGEEEAEDEDRYREAKHLAGEGVERPISSDHLSGRSSKFFSFFAFEGLGGMIRWKHEADDFHKDAVEMSELLTPQHNYRLSAKEMERKEFGEISCQKFRTSVIKEALPHKWERREDTSFNLAYFAKHKESTGPQRGERTQAKDKLFEAGINHDSVVAKTLGGVIASSSGAELASDAADGAERSHRHKTAGAPNVFVAHLAEGIQAVHLYTGRSICKLHLASPGLHADVNGDGIIEHVQVYGKDPEANFQAQHSAHQAIPGCSAVVTAGIPAHRVFNASVCKYMKTKSSFLRRNARLSELQVTHPALLPLEAHRIAAVARKRGASDAGVRKFHKFDLVFLNSYGEVTCLTSHGHRKWSVQAGSGWAGLDAQSEVDVVAPTLRTLELRVNAHNFVILSAGAHSANILSPNGRKLETIEFPSSPNLDLQVMDFNNDGLNDLVLCTAEGYYGYTQMRHYSTVPFTGLLACLLVAMVSVYVSLHGFAGGRKAKVKRATEAVD